LALRNDGPAVYGADHRHQYGRASAHAKKGRGAGNASD
jgi:hypothetical protein